MATLLDPKAAAEQSIEALDKVGRDIRRAILSALPCAADQYLTISMPGHVIDTKRGGEFIKSDTASAGELHQIRVNEARLVDSMIPLDTVMLGPTGKSVSRSYLASLDFLIPIDSEVGLPSMTPKESNSKPSNYMTAMNYLRKPPSHLDTKPEDRKKTVVDVYVEKQMEYTRAQIEWDNLQDRNAEDLQRNQGMTAEELEKRQSRMRTARYVLQARWMDWVVNGDKIIVDHHFAVVDISTVMSRIEASKEAARAANIMDLLNGTQWAQVTLQPKDWAVYCRAKAESWRGKNPLSPAVIELEIKRLLNLKAAYEGYRDGTMAESGPENPVGDPDEASEEAKAIKELNEAQAKLDALKKADPVDPAKVDPAVAKVETCKSALAVLQKGDKNRKIVKALDAARSKGMKTSLGKKIMDLDKEIAILRGHLAQCNSGFQRDVNTIVGVEEKKVAVVPAASGVVSSATEEAPPTPELKLIMANERETGADSDLVKGGSEPVEAPDPWTKIVFTSSTAAESSASSDKSMSAEAKLKIGGLFWGAQASTNVSEASRSLRQEATNHTINGSFSALLVKITRPWLHSELFSDYEIDGPENPKLSPGPVKFNQWLRDRNQTELGRFGMFPAYPTAFIVAAEVELEISCANTFASAFMESSSTDASFSVNYGPWIASASANLKMESKSTNQRMEATATGMKLSFQAPQIIGWVSEILPELPRNKDPLAPGGLVGAPMSLFRN